jgi:ribosomal protein L31
MMAKQGIHPKWYDAAPVVCNGTEVMTVGGTKASYNVDIYSGNHPFYMARRRHRGMAACARRSRFFDADWPRCGAAGWVLSAHSQRVLPAARFSNREPPDARPNPPNRHRASTPRWSSMRGS